jgi:hypothetical protein
MMAAVLVFAGLALAAIVFLTMLVGLVFQIALRILLFPIFLLKWVITGVVMLIVGPVLALVGIVLTVVFGVLLAVPLLPLIALGAIVWLIVRANRSPAVA